MRQKAIVAALSVLALASAPVPSLKAATATASTSSQEVTALRKEIESLREQLAAIRKDLQEIRGLLLTRQPTVTSPMVTAPTTPQDKLVSVSNRPTKGSPTAPLTLIEFSDSQ